MTPLVSPAVPVSRPARLAALLARITRSPLAIIACVYSLAHGVMLLDDGRFWDDWCIIGVDRAEMAANLGDMGVPLLAQLHLAMTWLPHPEIAYRVLAFLCFLSASLSLYAVLRTITGIDARTRLFICLIFSVLPVNAARIAACCAHYAVCYALFFAGVWLLSRHVRARGKGYRVAALVLLALSFSTTSLLAFQPLVLAYAAWMGSPRGVGLLARLRRNVDLIVLPIAYLVIRYAFFAPQGEFVDYNRVTREGLMSLDALRWAWSAVTGDLRAGPVALWAGMAITAIALWAVARLRPRAAAAMRQDLAWMALGFVMLLLAVYPYAVVDKQFTGRDWTSRFQLLMPLGSAFMLCFAAKLVEDAIGWSRWILVAGLGATTAAMLACTVNDLLEYQFDWHKQLATIERMRGSDELRDHATFEFIDAGEWLNAGHRVYGFYEYSGMMHQAFGTSTRYGSAEFRVDSGLLPRAHPAICHLEDYVPARSEYRVRIEPRTGRDVWVTTLPMLWWRIADHERYAAAVASMVSLSCEKISRP